MSTLALLRLNPEFQRCLWLELTPTRLVLMPSLLALALGSLHLTGISDLHEWIQYLLVFLLVLWGSRQAADSFTEEVAQGTWDVQRLSASNPWVLAWGKLLGGTIYVWYGALLCWLALAFLPDGLNGKEVLHTVVAGLSAQAVALLMVLIIYGFDPGRRRGATSFAQLAGIAAGFGLGGSLAGFALFSQFSPQFWYGIEIDTWLFSAVFQVVSLGWLLFAVAWVIRGHLGHAPSALPFFVFTLYEIGFGLGLLFNGRLVPPMPVMCGMAALIAAALAYVALLSSPLQVQDIKRLLRAQAWGQRLRLLPSWLPVAVLAVVLALTTIALGGREWTMAAAGLALFLRDLALVTAVRLLSRHRTMLLLPVLAVLLYGLLPEMLNGLGGLQAKAWLFPVLGASPTSLIGPWAQAVAALLLAGGAWLRRKGL